MSEADKATFLSWLRAGVHILATFWGTTHPDVVGFLEAGVPIVAMLVWTRIDNVKRSQVPAPSVSITNTLGLFVVIAGLTAGCASTPQDKIVRFAAVARSVSFEGALVYLQENPNHTKDLQAVTDQLDIAIKADQFTPGRLVAILKPLKIRELSSKEGRIAIAATIVIWDTLQATGAVVADVNNLKPVFEGLRDGFNLAIAATK